MPDATSNRVARPQNPPDGPVRAARERLAGVLSETPLIEHEFGDPRVRLRLKLECSQATGAFKARGAWNQVAQLTEGQARRGVVTASSGNHGKALAWAAGRAGVAATICMPRNAYRSKIEACREFGAEVILCEDRGAADRMAAERAELGAFEIPPYDSERTLHGQGTVALEVFEQWPETECLVVPVGGGGLLAGCSLVVAAVRARGQRIHLAGVEPTGAAAMGASFASGHAESLERVDSKIQGLTPPRAGAIPFAIARPHVDGMFALADRAILAAQHRLVHALDLPVEPAGAASFALLLGGFPEEMLAGRSSQDPLRVVCVVTGGNPDPDQLAAVRATAAGEPYPPLP